MHSRKYPRVLASSDIHRAGTHLSGNRVDQDFGGNDLPQDLRKLLIAQTL